jgi:hypothetical protein
LQGGVYLLKLRKKLDIMLFVFVLASLIYGSGVVFAKDSLESSIESLKNQKIISYEDFNALKTDNREVYVIDGQLGITVYPRRIKEEDIIALGEKINKKEIGIKDFNSSRFAELYGKYNIHTIKDMQGSDYIIFIYEKTVNVKFISNRAPFEIIVDGIKYRSSDKEKIIPLANGIKHSIKASSNGVDVVREVDLIAVRTADYSFDIRFTAASFWSNRILVLGIVVIAGALAVIGYIFVKKDPVVEQENENGNKSKSGKGSKSRIEYKGTTESARGEIVIVNGEPKFVDMLLKNNAYVGIFKTSIEKLKKDVDKASAVFEDSRYDIVRTETQADKTIDIRREVSELKKKVREMEIDLKHTKDNIYGISEEFSRIELPEINKKDKVIELCGRIQDKFDDVVQLHLNCCKLYDKSAYLWIRTNCEYMVPPSNHTYEYISIQLDELKGGIISLANFIHKNQTEVKQELQSINRYISSMSKQLALAEANVKGQVDQVANLITELSSSNADTLNQYQQTATKLITELISKNKEHYSKLEVIRSALEEQNYKGNSDLVNSVSNVNETIKKSAVEMQNYMESKIESVLSSLSGVVNKDKDIQVYIENINKSFPNLDKNSIEFLSLAKYLGEGADKLGMSDYSHVAIFYTKALENELKHFVPKVANTLSRMIDELKYKNEWTTFINDFNSAEIREIRNCAAHSSVVGRQMADSLRAFLLDKKVMNNCNGWLSFITSRKKNK